MIRDILRFNKEAPDFLVRGDHSTTLGEYLLSNGYRCEFTDHYIIPMGAAIWSAKPEKMLAMPA